MPDYPFNRVFGLVGFVIRDSVAGEGSRIFWVPLFWDSIFALISFGALGTHSI